MVILVDVFGASRTGGAGAFPEPVTGQEFGDHNAYVIGLVEHPNPHGPAGGVASRGRW